MPQVIIMKMIKTRLDACIDQEKPLIHLSFVNGTIIGGCSGFTGPTSPNPENDNRPYGPDFPLVTVRDFSQNSPCYQTV